MFQPYSIDSDLLYFDYSEHYERFGQTTGRMKNTHTESRLVFVRILFNFYFRTL